MGSQPKTRKKPAEEIAKVLDGSSERKTLTIDETAKILGIGRNQAYELANGGKLPVLRMGTKERQRILVLPEVLKRMLSGEAA